ncbi:polyketide synthase [Fusarium phyllophilum]|uniref:Polyketide synthase n=1 Tax=Fusarium phyllophilum TaxID=47803 RepID=A0A8H5J5G2_9HYPO|nr:polyketide synthase [Fusarium phyllophilum]
MRANGYTHVAAHQNCHSNTTGQDTDNWGSMPLDGWGPRAQYKATTDCCKKNFDRHVSRYEIALSEGDNQRACDIKCGLRRVCPFDASGMAPCSAVIKNCLELIKPGKATKAAALLMNTNFLTLTNSLPFLDPDANGYARGEAISAIFIKPLCDAIRDGNPVRAVIRSTVSNSDGKGTAGGIQVPNNIAQEAMIRQAYSIAGINDYSQTAFVECHGTGTSIGDPIETRAVGRVFGPAGGVMIGSVKPNLGHSEGASGLTSLIKAVLALENRTIPPNIKFDEPNPDIPWDACGLSVPTEPKEWPGSNMSVSASTLLALALLVFSANGPGPLRTMIANYEDYVMKNPKRVNDLSYTLGHKREHLPHRAFAVTSPLGALTTSPVSKAGQKPNIVMVFTGQGAQWPRIGRALIRSSQFPIFKKTIQALDAHLQTLELAPGWNIEEELQKSTKTSRLGSAELSQPLCTAIQVAPVDTFASIGVHPAAVVGHTSGEVAAAYAVGAITANEAITVAFYRGLVTKLQTKSGAMAAIGMGSEEIQEYMQPGVVIACENSPRSVTIAGDAEAVNTTTNVIKESHPYVMARLLQVDMAYHSHHMTEIGTDYYALMQNKIFPKKTTKLFFSSVKDELFTEASAFGPPITALVLNEGKPVEIMTTLRRKRLTNNLDREARSYGEGFGDAEAKAPFLRKVGTRRCYESMARSGLNFGPEFQRLDQIKADTQEQRADAKVAAKDGDNVDYHLHPTIIDATLQLLSVAASQGFAEPSDKTMVPTHIDEMCIYRSATAGDVDIQAIASYTASGSITGSGQGINCQGQLIFRSSGIRLSIVEGQNGDSPVEPIAHTEWAPHLEFLDTKTLIKTKVDRSEHMPDLTELSHLCMVHSKRVIAKLDTTVEHVHKYRSWINRQIQSQDLGYIESLSNDETRQRVKDLADKLMKTSAIDAAVAITKIFSYVASIFTSNVDALELLLANDTLNNLYVCMDQCDESQFLQHLAHSKPNLCVLEIGAGTGDSTAQLLEHLAPAGKVQYSNYTCTDISSGFFVEAKERFKEFPNMEFATLNISKDLAEQDFDGYKYDLILATNVIHATKSLNESLKNVRQLLGPNGRFLLHELTPTSKWVNYVWGTLAGWWYGEQDGRPDEPYVSIQRWEQELQAAGFRVPDAAVLDSAEPHQLNAMIVAGPATDDSHGKRVTLLTLPHYEIKSESTFRQTLEGRGYVVQHSVFSDLPVPNGQDIITVLDDEQPFFENLEERRFESFKTLAGNLKDTGILWITHLSQLHCSDPRFGQVLGISRTLRSEMLLGFATCEVDNIQSSSDRIVDVFERFQLRQEDDTLKPDYEYSVVENTVYVGRMHPFSAQANLLVPSEDDPVALRTSKPGRLDALHWASYRAPGLKDDDVEIKVQAAGLNFKDVLCAMGIVEGSNGFGLECAGIVGRVGPKVTGLKKGDRVMFISHSAFSTQVVVSDNLCEKIPNDLSFEDAATMPCSILVHSACGGIGISTIQLARVAGATIYATVSNEEKIQYLEEDIGLDRSFIFNSRNDSFVEEIMLKTGGKGVDLALNSLSGELLHATWKCIAPFGKMVEVGKRDLIGAGKLDMSIFEDNRSYSCVDLDQLCFQRGEIAKELLKSVIDLYEKRFIHPIRPIKVYNSPEILDSFRYMQQGVHLGKIAVSMDVASSDNLKVQPRKEPIRFGSSGSYLLRGARHLIYLSRSAGTQQKHLDLAQELDSYGCRVDFVQGSITSLEDVTVAVSRANGHLKGILQMSMVLCDQSFDKMTIKEWNTVVNPKAKGTWNLHNASLSVNTDLDFFILFSSLSGVIGPPGQANYAGANTFLDSFSQYRAHMGLPACAIQIGAVEEVG